MDLFSVHTADHVHEVKVFKQKMSVNKMLVIIHVLMYCIYKWHL